MEVTLENGLRVVTTQRPSRTVAARIYIRAGSRYDGEHPGKAHFVEHMLFNGTANRSSRQIHSDIECIGGSIQANTAKEYATFCAAVMDRELETGLDVLADVITNPTFDFTGKRVVFQTTLWDGNSEIAYLTLDPDMPFPYGPDDIVRVTNNPAADVTPAFSPDGDWIVIATNRDGNYELYKIWDPFSTDPPPFNPEVRLTFTPEDESDPDWSDYY